MSSFTSSTFKVKQNGYWQALSPEANHLLTRAYAQGLPSLRLGADGIPYKFDFEKRRQTNLTTAEECELCAPWGALDLIASAARSKFLGLGPAFAVRVPPGYAGKVAHVPHPKKLGKTIPVQVPADAQDDEVMFVPVPAQWKKKAKRVLGIGGGCAAFGAAGGFLVAQQVGGTSAVGAVGAGGGLAGLGVAAGPVLLTGLVVAGAVVTGAGAVAVANHYPAKFTAIGMVAVGTLAFADHVAEVGVSEAVADLAEGAGDMLDGSVVARDALGEIAEDIGDTADDAFDLCLEAAEETGSLLENILEHLF